MISHTTYYSAFDTLDHNILSIGLNEIGIVESGEVDHRGRLTSIEPSQLFLVKVNSTVGLCILFHLDED